MIKEPNLSQVNKIIAKAYPGVQVLDFQKAGLSNMNWVFFIDLKNPLKKVILKVVFRQDREEDEILAKEATIIKILNQHKVQGVPKLIGFDHSKKVVPYVYLLESFLAGKPLIDCYKELKIENLRSIIKKSARLITDIQQIKYGKITEFEKNRPEFKSFHQYIINSSPKHYQVCLKSNRMPKKLTEASYKFVLAGAKKIKDKRFVLNHADFSSHNLLISQGKFSGLIDFEACQTMTPEFDLVTFYHEFLWKKPELWPVLLKEYVKINKAPQDFEERLNIIMGYRSFRYLYIAIKNRMWQYFNNDVKRMEEVLDGRFLKTIKIKKRNSKN